MTKTKYYSLDAIKRYNADYNIIFGERSNGKTTAVLREGLEEFVNSGYENQLGIIRRWEEDLKRNKAQQLFENIVNLGWVTDLTGGQYNAIYYYSKNWYLAFYDKEGNKLLQMEKPFATGFSISSQEHYKSNSYLGITTILFDEFITRDFYLPDEFIKFQNLLSTIIRLRTNVKIYMCGNTINKFNPYFDEMGLRNAKKQKQGTIDVYTYGESGLKVACEYSDFNGKKKESNKYFAFDNPKLNMITNGGWEIDIYPHLPCRYRPCDVKYQFFIAFDGEYLHGNYIVVEGKPFVYLHRKTTPIKEDTKFLVYHQQPNPKINYRTNFLKPYKKPDTFILQMYTRNKFFYQDNEVGELFSNYIKWCMQNR